jgi:integrase
MAALSLDDCTASHALRFLTLTACRTNEVVGAKWSEIDLDDKLWTIPKERMKARRPHRVPLSQPALRLLKKVAKNQVGEFVFWFQKPTRPLSNMAMLTNSELPFFSASRSNAVEAVFRVLRCRNSGSWAGR